MTLALQLKSSCQLAICLQIETEDLCALKIYALNPKAKYNDIWRWGLWEVVRSGGWNPHEWGLCPYQKDSRVRPCPLCHMKIQQ